MKGFPTLKEIELKGKKVLCRFDFNVPINMGVIGDDSRLKASLPTIEYLRERNSKIIMLSHLGRPGGERVPELSLKPVAERLGDLLGAGVGFIDRTTGEDVKKRVHGLKEGELLLLENTRFQKGEKENDESFSRELAELASVYVNDAFGTAHRKHASTYGVAFFMKEKAAGLLMENEIENLSMLTDNPRHPYSVILGGAKLKTKIPVIKNLAEIIDNLLIGGGMVFGFLHRKGIEVGDSLLDEELLPEIEDIFRVTEEKNVNLILPEDIIITDEIVEGARNKTVKIEEILEGWKGVDIGPNTIKKFRKVILDSRMVFWNGPMGVFEIEPFDRGTVEIVKALGKATEKNSVTIVGGGDTDKAIHGTGVKLTHTSTGGGAALKFLTGEELPAITALNKEV